MESGRSEGFKWTGAWRLRAEGREGEEEEGSGAGATSRLGLGGFDGINDGPNCPWGPVNTGEARGLACLEREGPNGLLPGLVGVAVVAGLPAVGGGGGLVVEHSGGWRLEGRGRTGACVCDAYPDGDGRFGRVALRRFVPN